MLENVGKINWLTVAGNRRDKFISWLTKICPKYKIWHYKKEWLLLNYRYRKYNDKIRYPDEKFLTIMNKSFPIYIEYEMSEEFIMTLYFSIFAKKDMDFNKIILEFFKINFDANINNLFWASENHNLSNLIINPVFMNKANLSNIILVKSTMKG